MADDNTPEKTPEEIWAELDNETSAPTEVVHDEPKEEPKKEEPAAKPEAAPEAAPAEPAADDPFKGLPEIVKNTIVGLQTQVGSLQQRVRQAEGRVGELNGTVKQWTTAPRGPSPAETAAAKADPAKLAQLRENYPELFEGFEALLASRLPEKGEEEAPQAGLSAQEVRALLEKQEKDFEVEISHRGWKKTVQSPAFAGWYAQQQPEIRALADSDEPAAAIRMLDLFVAANAKKAPNPNLAAAAAIPTGKPGNTASYRGKTVDEMNPREYWDYLEAQDRAAARGK